MTPAIEIQRPATGRRCARVLINGKPVQVEWSRAAERALARRSRPLVVELELYFSCLVKKFVHFHDERPGLKTVPVDDRLRLGFRAVTSSACSLEEARQRGRQPEIEIQTEQARRFAPKSVRIDFTGGRWRGSYRL
ncbi:MAG: hypothetical protein H6934_07135 [Burkholderiaceae bacterium]|nr:hypothetical protein [Burkholderiaceae bacterium]